MLKRHSTSHTEGRGRYWISARADRQEGQRHHRHQEDSREHPRIDDDPYRREDHIDRDQDRERRNRRPIQPPGRRRQPTENQVPGSRMVSAMKRPRSVTISGDGGGAPCHAAARKRLTLHAAPLP